MRIWDVPELRTAIQAPHVFPPTITSRAWHFSLPRKDISERGIFFYSDFGPSVGDEVYFVVEYLSGQNRVRFPLNGRVARVEQAEPGSAHGIAISFYSQRDEVPTSPVVARAI
jgi:hypothetical protein